VIVPRRQKKLYRLGQCSDVDVGTAAADEVGRLRSKGYKPTVAAERGSIAGPISLHEGSRIIISGNETCCGPISVV
jgi:hypothetical protein